MKKSQSEMKKLTSDYRSSCAPETTPETMAGEAWTAAVPIDLGILFSIFFQKKTDLIFRVGRPKGWLSDPHLRVALGQFDNSI